MAMHVFVGSQPNEFPFPSRNLFDSDTTLTIIYFSYSGLCISQNEKEKMGALLGLDFSSSSEFSIKIHANFVQLALLCDVFLFIRSFEG